MILIQPFSERESLQQKVNETLSTLSDRPTSISAESFVMPPSSTPTPISHPRIRQPNRLKDSTEMNEQLQTTLVGVGLPFQLPAHGA